MSPKLRSDLILLLAAAIWGFAFVAQRIGMDFLGPFTYTAVRFSLGTLVLLPFYFYRVLNGKGQKSNLPEDSPSTKSGGSHSNLMVLQGVLGLILFGGISFQQYGLQFTTAGNAGFITGFYVVLVPVVGIFLAHKSHITIWAGVVLTITGLYFLSVGEGFVVNRGDLLVGVCALFWTAHVLLVGYVAPRTDAIATAIIQFSICSFLSWLVAIGFEEISFQSIFDAAWPILYGGVLSVGLAYTLQVVAQQNAHPAYASIILSLESVFAVFGGWLILDEHFSSRALLGCSLMLAGMIIVQVKDFMKEALPKS
jgi:drug/metabolite transporter (DMT)-like permease